MADARKQPNDGGPAFPVDQAGEPRHPGMSLRDYLAAKAVAALLTHWVVSNAAGIVGGETEPERQYGEKVRGRIGRTAYAVADDMLAERDRRG